MKMAKSLTEMAVEIAAAQASHAKMSPDEVDEFLKKTFERLKQMKGEEEVPQERVPEAKEAVPPVEPQKSIQRNKVICLECGKEFRQLTNAHLKSHGLTAQEYRKKWGFPARQPLAAKSLSAKRRKIAKDMNLAERLRKVREARKKR